MVAVITRSWERMSLGVAEAPHLCTSALRLMGKQTGRTVLKAVKTPHEFMVN